jgi:hypothetical protein
MGIIGPDVSEEAAVSIFRDKFEAVGSSETLVSAV